LVALINMIEWRRISITSTSKQVAVAAIKMALTDSREEEKELKQEFLKSGILAAAVDYGGEALSSVTKVIERSVVAAKREGIITETHASEGAVAGATHEAMTQILPKAMGMNVGGKVGIARHEDHLSVAILFNIGMLHLNEVAIGLAHRALK